jgi:hypothetical protein
MQDVMPNEKPAVADDEARKDRQWERHKKACQNRRRVIDREHDVFVRVGMVPLMAAVEEQPMQHGAMHPIFNKREQQRAAGRRTNPPSDRQSVATIVTASSGYKTKSSR